MREFDELRAWTETHAAEIDRAPAAWCALELASVDLLARQRGESWETVLGLPELSGSFRFTAVLGDQSDASFAKQLSQYRGWGFDAFKIKLSGDFERDSRKLASLAEAGIDPGRIRVDANNLWNSAAEVLPNLTPLAGHFSAIEEPLKPGAFGEMRQLGESLGLPIILDESFLRAENFAEIQRDPERWWINLRVSKMGGLLRSLGIVRLAAGKGIPVVVGAQVGETSILTRAGLTIAQQAGKDLHGHEGAFGTHLLENDVTEPPLMFGQGGRLKATEALRAPLKIARPEAWLTNG